MCKPTLQLALRVSAFVSTVTGASRASRFPAVFVLFASALLVSCANPPRDTAGADQECVYVKVTGSNMPVKECRTAAEREALAAQNEEAAQQGLRDLRALDEFGVASPGADSLD
ncbi:MAG: hypothetical protein ACO1PZ_05540 [Gammaproteobacteria bacterium]